MVVEQKVFPEKLFCIAALCRESLYNTARVVVYIYIELKKDCGRKCCGVSVVQESIVEYIAAVIARRGCREQEATFSYIRRENTEAVSYIQCACEIKAVYI